MMDDYIDSGVEWIGKIPSDWKVENLKYILSKKITDGPHETPNFVDEGIPFLSVDGIVNGKLDFENCRYISNKEARRFNKKCIPEKNDILMGKAASTGKIALVETAQYFQIWSPLAIIKTRKDIETRYVRYYLSSEAGQTEIEILCTNNTQKNIAMEDIAIIKICIPDKNEQKAIAKIIELKLKTIDNIILDLQKQIELLDEYKKSIITETVTKGLNKNVEMKDSKVEYIGKISKDFKIIKLKYIGRVQGRIGFKGYNAEDLVEESTKGCAIVLGGTNVMKGGYISYDKLTYINEYKYFQSPEIMLKGNEIIITKVGAGTGENALYKYYQERMTINPNVMLYISDSNHSPEYINYYLLNKLIKAEIKLESEKSGAQPSINQSYIKNVFISIPPIDVQNKIVNYLDEKCDNINLILQEKKQNIEKMQEYKKSIIYEYVTGKKRVK